LDELCSRVEVTDLERESVYSSETSSPLNFQPIAILIVMVPFISEVVLLEPVLDVLESVLVAEVVNSKSKVAPYEVPALCHIPLAGTPLNAVL
jgi:hypothetical protein